MLQMKVYKHKTKGKKGSCFSHTFFYYATEDFLKIDSMNRQNSN